MQTFYNPYWIESDNPYITTDKKTDNLRLPNLIVGICFIFIAASIVYFNERAQTRVFKLVKQARMHMIKNLKAEKYNESLCYALVHASG
jgi:hypothetical protein